MDLQENKQEYYVLNGVIKRQFQKKMRPETEVRMAD
jgi:hypothetical protein